MRKTLKGIGRRTVRKAVSITSELDKILNEMSNATGGALSPAEIMSVLLHEALKSDNTLRWFEHHYVDLDAYCLRIIYTMQEGKKERCIRSERQA